jgi:acyl-homoserine lactone acylase PvdQ
VSSPHYNDQLVDWLAGKYHDLPLASDGIGAARLLLLPD